MTHRNTEKLRILVTGGAGYIGAHVTELLLNMGHQVVVLERFYYGRAGLSRIFGHKNLILQEGDISSIRDMARALKGCDAVIALAAIVGDPACELNHDETLVTNYESTKVLAELCRYHKVRRVVFASSCSVYGANASYLLNEGSWLNPVSLYAETRIMSEKVLLAQLDHLDVVILRLGTVYGVAPRMRFDLVVNTMAAKAFFEGAISVYGKEQFRPLVHVRDAARAFIAAALAPPERVAGQILNVGATEENFTIDQIGQAVVAEFPKTQVSYHEIVDRRDYRVDFSKIRALLGFRPEHTLADGLSELRNFFDAHPELNYRDDIYYNVNYLFKSLEA